MSNSIKLNNLYILYLLNFLIMPIGFLIRILYSKTLPISDFGIIYSVIAFYNVLFLFSNIGIGNAINYLIPKFLIKKNLDKVRNILFLSSSIYLFITMFFSILILFFSENIAILYFKDINSLIYIKLFLIYFISNNILMIFIEILTAFKYMVSRQLITFLKTFLILISNLILLIYIENLNLIGKYFALTWGLASIISMLVFLIYIYSKIPWLFLKLPKFDKLLFFELISYSKFIFLSNFGLYFISQGDILLITFILGTTLAGIYNSIISIILIFLSILGSVGVILIPIISEFSEKKNFKAIEKVVNIIYSIGLSLIIPFSILIFFYSDFIILLLFNSNFLVASLSLKILAILGTLRVLSEYNKNILIGIGKAKILSKLTLILAILNILMNIFLISLIGIEGSALTTIFIWSLYLFFSTYFILDSIKLKLNYNKILKIFIFSIIFILEFFILNRIINLESILIEAIILILITFITYFVLINMFSVILFEEILEFFPKNKYLKKFIKFKKIYLNFIK